MAWGGSGGNARHERRPRTRPTPTPRPPLGSPWSSPSRTLVTVALVGKAELARRAEALGHTGLRIYPTKSGRRWVCECACGWGALDSGGRPTVTRATQPEAILSLQHHLWKALETDSKDRVRNGVSDTRVVS